MESMYTRGMNPWFSMWTKPRATIQQIIEKDPEHLVPLLAALYGFSHSLERASLKRMGDDLSLPMILWFGALGGIIGGLIFLYMGGALIRWTGTWLGGQGTPREIRAALAWSCVPVIWAILLWIVQLVLFGHELFTTETPTLDANPGMSLFLFGLIVIQMIAGVWAFVVCLKCLGQVQGFSAWRALGNIILAGLIIVVMLLLILVGIMTLATLI